jgi:hypothetical protein
LTREDQDRVFYREVDDLIQEDHRYIKSWLRLAERTICMAKKEVRTKTNSQQLIETFFQWKPPGTKKQHTAAELQPD